jgi:HD-GYP domain-containing protein (c-di-GMP phosphodiesterase class II)
MVLYWVMKDEEAREMSEEDRNILKWAALFHDIKK